MLQQGSTPVIAIWRHNPTGKLLQSDMLNKVQINYYAAGLHRKGSDSVFRYTELELADRISLLNAAFGETNYRADKKLQALTDSKDAGQ